MIILNTLNWGFEIAILNLLYCWVVCKSFCFLPSPMPFSVSRKRKSKNWEDEDFYDSDDDTFLDRTGAVEKKRLNRMKKAGKIEEKPETYDSLVRIIIMTCRGYSVMLVLYYE